MSARMTVCAACERHVKSGECACPFCGAKVACAKGAADKAPSRLSRAALYTLGAAGVLGASVAVTNCGAYGGPPTGGTGGAGGGPTHDGGPG